MLLCKKDGKFPIFNVTHNMYIKQGFFYLCEVENNGIRVFDGNDSHYFAPGSNSWLFEDYFYTEKELRKEKLKILNKKRA
jgi:hypothetical protein